MKAIIAILLAGTLFLMGCSRWENLTEEEKQAICDYMDEGGWLTEFKKTQLFESMIAEYTGAKHCIVVNNGTIDQFNANGDGL